MDPCAFLSLSDADLFSAELLSRSAAGLAKGAVSGTAVAYEGAGDMGLLMQGMQMRVYEWEKVFDVDEVCAPPPRYAIEQRHPKATDSESELKKRAKTW